MGHNDTHDWCYQQVMIRWGADFDYKNSPLVKSLEYETCGVIRDDGYDKNWMKINDERLQYEIQRLPTLRILYKKCDMNPPAEKYEYTQQKVMIRWKIAKDPEEVLRRAREAEDRRKRDEEKRRVQEDHDRRMAESGLAKMHPYLDLEVAAPIGVKAFAKFVEANFRVHIQEMKKWKKKKPDIVSILKREKNGEKIECPLSKSGQSWTDHIVDEIYAAVKKKVTCGTEDNYTYFPKEQFAKYGDSKIAFEDI